MSGLARSGVEYVDYALNAITGCRHGCPWCWAERFSKRLAGRFGYPADEPFEPTFRRKPLDHLAKTSRPGVVSVCWMGDMWGSWVPQHWINEVLAGMLDRPEHQYLLLTKNPAGYGRIMETPSNWWFGVSVQSWSVLHRIDKLKSIARPGANLWVSFEPIIGSLRLEEEVLEGLSWVVFGAMTGPDAKRYQESDIISIKHAVRLASKMGIPVFVKDNLMGRLVMDDIPRETPWSLL